MVGRFKYPLPPGRVRHVIPSELAKLTLLLPVNVSTTETGELGVPPELLATVKLATKNPSSRRSRTPLSVTVKALVTSVGAPAGNTAAPHPNCERDCEALFSFARAARSEEHTSE